MSNHCGGRLTHSIQPPAFSDDGHLEPWEDFDYDSVEKFRAANKEAEAIEKGIAAGQEIIRTLITWIWQDGMKDARGIQIRSIIVCWIFLPHLRPLSLTELARGFGKDKQSLGRWVDDFKIKFPNLKTPHMK